MTKRKLAIDKGQARRLALEHVEKLDLRGYRYEFADINPSARAPFTWAAVFDVYTAAGDLMDGPVVFVVDTQTGKVRSLDEASSNQ